jgi:hypothetical protein
MHCHVYALSDESDAFHLQSKALFHAEWSRKPDVSACADYPVPRQPHSG